MGPWASTLTMLISAVAAVVIARLVAAARQESEAIKKKWIAAEKLAEATDDKSIRDALKVFVGSGAGQKSEVPLKLLKAKAEVSAHKARLAHSVELMPQCGLLGTVRCHRYPCLPPRRKPRGCGTSTCDSAHDAYGIQRVGL